MIDEIVAIPLHRGVSDFAKAFNHWKEYNREAQVISAEMMYCSNDMRNYCVIKFCKKVKKDVEDVKPQYFSKLR